MKRISPLVAYVACVCAAGAAVVAAILRNGEFDAITARPGVFFMLFALLLVGELRPIQVKRGSAGSDIAISTPFVFALMLTCGLGPAIIGLSVASAFADLVQRKSWVRVLFNSAQYSVSLGCCGWLLAAMSNGTTYQNSNLTALDLGYVLVAGLVFFLLNSTLPTIAAALDQNVSPLRLLRRDFAYQIGTAGAMVVVSPLIVVAAEHSLLLLPTLLLPAGAVHWSARVSLQNEHQSMHDSLTGLPNRSLFHSLTNDAIGASGRSAVMLVDLDHFKEINDTLGHRTGDALLHQVGERLQRALGGDAAVARLGGDEFALLVPQIDNPVAALDLGQQVLNALAEGFVVDDFALSVEASIGIAMAPEDGEDSGTLLRCADVAMYLAKQGRGGCELYSPMRDQHSRERLELIGHIRGAIAGDQLVVHYQPKLDLRSDRVVGAEALVRWNHPERGLLMPDMFIPLIERSVHMAAFTGHVLRLALEQCARWRAEGIDLTIAVNVPVTNLHDSMFPVAIAQMLEQTAVPAHMLELEITEGTIMADPLRAMGVLQALHTMGVGLSIDDFGTGYSSLAYLKRLPVDTLKIDKSFVINMSSDLDDERIVTSTLGLARSLGLKTVAEGVENARTLQTLREAGADYAQGYFIGKPMPAVEMTAMVAPAATPHTLHVLCPLPLEDALLARKAL